MHFNRLDLREQRQNAVDFSQVQALAGADLLDCLCVCLWDKLRAWCCNFRFHVSVEARDSLVSINIFIQNLFPITIKPWNRRLN